MLSFLMLTRPQVHQHMPNEGVPFIPSSLPLPPTHPFRHRLIPQHRLSTSSLESNLKSKQIKLIPLESALPQNVPVTPLGSALTISLDLKLFRIRTCKKRVGEGQTVN
jgi:hypothetical protein